MKYCLLFFALFITMLTYSQVESELMEGNVTFINHLNVYVSFVNTSGIKVGDSLYVYSNNKLKPVLYVTGLSSSSCVAKPSSDFVFFVSCKIVAKKRVSKPIEVLSQQELEAVAVADAALFVPKPKVDNSQKEHFDGRISVSSYSTFTNNIPNLIPNDSLSIKADTLNSDTLNAPQDYSKVNSIYRMRYNLDLNAYHISNSKFSFETSMAFTHRLFTYNTAYDGLRVYDLAFKYDLSKTTTLTAGRKINLSMANVGAVDGLQLEKAMGNFSAGALLGSRPNDSTYAFDSKLLQYGAYVAHNLEKDYGYMSTSFVIFNQTRNLVTDRRYAYFQHSNSLLDNLDLFCSLEMDLYKLDKNLKPVSTLDFTGTYASLRYRPWKQLSMSFTYDARNNVYYYETIKKPIDSIYDKFTRQGYRFQTTIRPFKNVVIGGWAGYRYNPKDTVPSINGHSYLTIANVPYINSSLTISATAFNAVFVDGVIYDIGLMRDIVAGIVYGEVHYKYENYTYKPTTTFYKTSSFLQSPSLPQNAIEFSLDWRLSNKLILSTNFELVKSGEFNYGRLFMNISHRF